MGFKIPEGTSLKGLVLTAAPELLDPNFNQTIVYIAEHTFEGALGMVMNRPLSQKLGEIAASTELPEALRELMVLRGGPVKPTSILFARFERGKNDEELDCQIVADPARLIDAPNWDWVRAFAGYAGWSAGQLETELSERAWVICRPHAAMLQEPVPPALWEAFSGADQRWRKLQAFLPKNTNLN